MEESSQLGTERWVLTTLITTHGSSIQVGHKGWMSLGMDHAYGDAAAAPALA
jgi:hypothetical protein